VDNKDLELEENNDNKEIIQNIQQDKQQDISTEEDEVARLKKEFEKKQEESQDNYDKYLRALAELENIKKRAAREREEYIKYASLPLIKKLLPVIDDLDRALSISENNEDYEALKKGVEMIAKSLHEVIKGEGVESIEAVGRPFDPQYHQPLLVEDNDMYPENTVIEELQRGYVLNDRVIRPSLVKVSK